MNVFHDISSSNPMTFSALAVIPRNPDSPNIQNGAANYIRPLEKFHVLGEDGEDVPAKLQNYAEAMALKTYDEESSVFTKRTLKLALELSLRKDVSNLEPLRI